MNALWKIEKAIEIHMVSTVTPMNPPSDVGLESMIGDVRPLFPQSAFFPLGMLA